MKKLRPGRHSHPPVLVQADVRPQAGCPLAARVASHAHESRAVSAEGLRCAGVNPRMQAAWGTGWSAHNNREPCRLWVGCLAPGQQSSSVSQGGTFAGVSGQQVRGEEPAITARGAGGAWCRPSQPDSGLRVNRGHSVAGSGGRGGPAPEPMGDSAAPGLDSVGAVSPGPAGQMAGVTRTQESHSCGRGRGPERGAGIWACPSSPGEATRVCRGHFQGRVGMARAGVVRSSKSTRPPS